MANRRQPTPPPIDQVKPNPPPAPPAPVAVEPGPAQAPISQAVLDQDRTDRMRLDDRLNPAPHQAAALALRRDDTMALAFQGLVPSSLGEALQLSQSLARSKAIPSSLRGDPESIFTIIMAGMELGLTPLRSIQNISNISGTLCQKADLQLALVRRSGSLAYFNEGFELKSVTDGNLADRLGAAGDVIAADVSDLILDLTEALPDGKPYGWCTVQRVGDTQRHTRVFTWADAERFTYSEWEGEGGGRSKQTKKLSEKSAYVHNPQDMYPKRARVRVLQITHSDVLAGMPAIEAMDGVTIEGTVVHSEEATSSEDAITQALNELDPATAAAIGAGFAQLQLGIAKRLQLLRKHQDDPSGAGLLDWLKTEYANRNSKGGRARPDVLSGQEAQQPLDARAHAGDGDSAAREANAQPAAKQEVKAPPPPAASQDPGREVKAAGGGMEQIKSVAERFKSTLRSI